MFIWILGSLVVGGALAISGLCYSTAQALSVHKTEAVQANADHVLNYGHLTMDNRVEALESLTGAIDKRTQRMELNQVRIMTKMGIPNSE